MPTENTPCIMDADIMRLFMSTIIYNYFIVTIVSANARLNIGIISLNVIIAKERFVSPFQYFVKLK